MSEQAKKLLIPVLNQDDENPPPVQQTETDLSVSKGEDNEQATDVQQDETKDPETMSGRTAALIEERGGIESAAGTVVQTIQEDKFLRALQSYFRIKSSYDTAFTRKKNKIIRNTNISLREKKERVDNIKMKCVLCKRNVGTLFSHKGKHYRAICGDRAQPCNLNIDLEAGSIINILSSLEMMQQVYLEDVTNIMKAKLDLLFNFKSEDEVLAEFEQINESLKANNKIIKHYTDLRDDMIESEEKREKLEDLDNGINVLIEEFKKLIAQYKKEKQIAVLKEAMELQQTKLAPLLAERTKTRYAYNEIEQNPHDETFHLVQKKYLKNKLEDVIQPAKIITNKITKK
jgi:hypothetical protein